MRISPISNNQLQFKARLSAKDLDFLAKLKQHPEYARIQKTEGNWIVPQLYTMVELLDRMQGEKASFLCSKSQENECFTLDEYQYEDVLSFTIDNDVIYKDDNEIIHREPASPIAVLYNAVTKRFMGRSFRMPLSFFQKEVLRNSDKTIEDIKKFAIKE